MSELEQLNRVEASTKYLVDNLAILRKKYPGQYVAIKDGKVVLTERDFDILLMKIKESGLSTQDILIDYIPAKGFRLFV